MSNNQELYSGFDLDTVSGPVLVRVFVSSDADEENNEDAGVEENEGMDNEVVSEDDEESDEDSSNELNVTVPTAELYTFYVSDGPNGTSYKLRVFSFRDTLWVMCCDAFTFLKQSSGGSRLNKVSEDNKGMIQYLLPEIKKGDIQTKVYTGHPSKAAAWYNVFNYQGVLSYLETQTSISRRSQYLKDILVLDIAAYYRDNLKPIPYIDNMLAKTAEHEAKMEEIKAKFDAELLATAIAESSTGEIKDGVGIKMLGTKEVFFPPSDSNQLKEMLDKQTEIASALSYLVAYLTTSTTAHNNLILAKHDEMITSFDALVTRLIASNSVNTAQIVSAIDSLQDKLSACCGKDCCKSSESPDVSVKNVVIQDYSIAPNIPVAPIAVDFTIPYGVKSLKDGGTDTEEGAVGSTDIVSELPPMWVNGPVGIQSIFVSEFIPSGINGTSDPNQTSLTVNKIEYLSSSSIGTSDFTLTIHSPDSMEQKPVDAGDDVNHDGGACISVSDSYNGVTQRKLSDLPHTLTAYGYLAQASAIGSADTASESIPVGMNDPSMGSVEVGSHVIIGDGVYIDGSPVKIDDPSLNGEPISASDKVTITIEFNGNCAKDDVTCDHPSSMYGSDTLVPQFMVSDLPAYEDWESQQTLFPTLDGTLAKYDFMEQPIANTPATDATETDAVDRKGIFGYSLPNAVAHTSFCDCSMIYTPVSDPTNPD